MSYDDAVPIPGSPSFTRGVKPRWEQSPATVWLGVPIHFVRYDPPSNQPTQTVNVAGDARTVARWTDTEWSDFKRDFVEAINDFWHYRFVLTPASGTTRGLRQGTPGALLCGYKAWAESNSEWATMKPLVFKPAGGGFQRSRCGFFGRPVSAGLPSGAPRWVTAVLDKNDTVSASIVTAPPPGSTSEPVTSRQRGATHESGHHIGLMHRCTSVRVRDVPSYRQFNVDTYSGGDSDYEGAYVHEQARATSRGGDGYCVASNNADAIRDLMARGENCHPWHAAPWIHILQSAAVATTGSVLHSVSRISWVPILARPNPPPETPPP